MSREDEKSGGIVAINRYKIGSDRKRRAFKDERNDPAWQSGDRSLELGVSHCHEPVPSSGFVRNGFGGNCKACGTLRKIINAGKR